MMSGQWAGWWLPVVVLVSVLFLGVIAVGVVFLVRPAHGDSQTAHRPRGSQALDILDERLARGEIDEQRYEELRRVLMSGG